MRVNVPWTDTDTGIRYISTFTENNGNAVTAVSYDSSTRALKFTKGSKFLTSHQTVTNSAPTLSWGTTSTIGTVGSTNLTVTMPSNPNTDSRVKTENTNSGDKYLVGVSSTTSTGQTAYTNSSIKMNGTQITAGSFNVNSDRELKTDFVKLSDSSISALDVINNVSVYTYYMKSDEKKENRCLGIVAQDIEKYNIDNFNFVDFDEEKDKYRSLKESKLVYLLWKGMQELTEKYNELERKYEELSKRVGE